MTKPIHPFPARMASDLALAGLAHLYEGSVVLDPMVGSGTVIRHATDLGHTAWGFDMDPLAVLMSRVWTTPVSDEDIGVLAERLLADARAIAIEDVALGWIDGHPETVDFIAYWFAPKQRDDLRRLAFVLEAAATEADGRASAALDVLRLAMSRIIITKEQGASLARDTSHSRPHKVAETSTYDVFSGFERALRVLRKHLMESPPKAGALVRLGDARTLTEVDDRSVDAVLTSPPYLNAIDYLRGHRLALVWLGRNFKELRTIRSNSIGAERAPDVAAVSQMFTDIRNSMGDVSELPRRYGAMMDRYAEDLYRMLVEVARVLKPEGKATFVVGNSCLKGVFIQNSAGLSHAAKLAGLTLTRSVERDLPESRRYLPITGASALGKRMRTETVLTFSAAAA